MGPANGWIELVLIEAKDLVAADLRGTSDPYVRVQYGKLKKRTKVQYSTILVLDFIISYLSSSNFHGVKNSYGFIKWLES